MNVIEIVDRSKRALGAEVDAVTIATASPKDKKLLLTEVRKAIKQHYQENQQ